MTRQRLIDIVTTALVGAFIAFLQALLMGMTATTIPPADPALAAGFAGLLKASHGYISRG